MALRRGWRGVPGPQKAAHRSVTTRTHLQITCAVKRPAEKHVVCSKTLVARQGEEQRVAQLCASLAEHSQRQQADREAGLLSFEVVRDGWEASTFHFWERYASNSHLGRYNTSKEYQQFMEEVQPLLDGPVGMALYEYKNGRIGAACVQGGPKGEGGLDDATGGNGQPAQTSQAVDLTQVNEHDDDAQLLENFKQNMNKQMEGVKSVLSNIFGGAAKTR